MLPDIRAVIAATVAAIGLLLISFALVTTYRVAQQHQAGPPQADVAKRGRAVVPAQSGERQIPIIETPGPHLALPVQASEPAAIVPPTKTVSAPPVPEPAPPTPVAAAPQPPAPPAELPIGGPLAAPPDSSRSVAAENPSRVDSSALQRAERARKARAARIARERKAAARRAAQARRIRRTETPSFGSNSYGGSFGGTFTAPPGR